jgi:hypothetical protein
MLIYETDDLPKQTRQIVTMFNKKYTLPEQKRTPASIICTPILYEEEPQQRTRFNFYRISF